MIRVKPKNLESLLIMSFRYSLERTTYAASMTVEIIKAHKDTLAPWVVDLFLREIAQAIAQNRAGMACDVETWSRFEAWLIENFKAPKI